MSDYDKNGFDEDWIHKDTGTRYDIFGFNKNGTIHKNTHTAKDEFSRKRGHYLREGICSYSDIVLGKLFFNTAILNFNGEKFIDAKLNYKNVSKIELSSFCAETKTNYKDNRPSKLNGTPDYRYKSNGKFSTQNTILYTIVYHTKEPNEKVSYSVTSKKSLSKNNIGKTIERYNLILSSLKNPKIRNLYEEFLYIKEECKVRIKKISRLKLDKKEKLAVYNKLNLHKESFTEDQQKKFKNLKQEIDNISSSIDKRIYIEKKFKIDLDDIYKKLEAELEVEKNYQKKVEENINSSQADNEINDLFKQLK